MKMKCNIIREVDGFTICWTMEEAELVFKEDFIDIMKGTHGYYKGNVVPDDTPLGYVGEIAGLDFRDAYEVYYTPPENYNG